MENSKNSIYLHLILTPSSLRESIIELPYLEYDRGYRKSDWQQSPFHLSYLARAFMTWFPRWEAVAPDVSDEALVSVNASILKTFVQIGRANGDGSYRGLPPEKGT